MELTYQSPLMPASYTALSADEMTYIDGGAIQIGSYLIEFHPEALLQSVVNFTVNFAQLMGKAALGTAVQTAVKRPDEQAFALANGQNLMFCEDAARRLNLALQRTPGIKQLHIRVIHAESLHAHDAVAESSWQREQI